MAKAKFKGTREAFGAALYDLASNDSSVTMVSADSLKSARATRLADDFPDQYVECGIAEQCAVDVAAGLTTAGLIPFVATYAGFLTMRACEQMRTFVAYPNLNVKVVGMNGGMAGGEREGCTHQFFEDVSIVSSIPNFKIFLPADPAQTYHAVKLAYQTDGPVYIRIGSGREKDIFDLNTPFSLDGIHYVRDAGSEILLCSSGFILDRLIQTADKLIQDGYKITLIDVHMIGDEDNPAIVDLLKKANQVFTFEDHNIHGGVGSYIASIAGKHAPVPVHKFGLNSFAESGETNELLDKYGFTPENLVSKIKDCYSKTN